MRVLGGAYSLLYLLVLLAFLSSSLGRVRATSSLRPVASVVAFPDCNGLISDIGNGACSVINNNAECGYDGGDCCLGTCIDTVLHTCGVDGYDCKDPTVSIDFAGVAVPARERKLPCSNCSTTVTVIVIVVVLVICVPLVGYVAFPGNCRRRTAGRGTLVHGASM